MVFKCIDCMQSYYKKLDEDLPERSENTSDCLMLQEAVHPYEYMESWQRLNETSLPDKKEFYSNLTMEDITYADYKHGKRVSKDFAIKKRGWLS